MRGTAPSLVDVLTNDSDPAGGLLAVQTASAGDPTQLDVGVVDDWAWEGPTPDFDEWAQRLGEPRLGEPGELRPERVQDLIEREPKLVAQAKDALFERRQSVDQRKRPETP